MLRGVVYRLIESLASKGHIPIWKLICAISVCYSLTVSVHLSSTPGISGPGSATGGLCSLIPCLLLTMSEAKDLARQIVVILLRCLRLRGCLLERLLFCCFFFAGMIFKMQMVKGRYIVCKACCLGKNCEKYHPTSLKLENGKSLS